MTAESKQADIGTLFALYRERCKLETEASEWVWARLVLWEDGSGHVSAHSSDDNRLMQWDSPSIGISKLQAAIEATASKSSLPEADGKFYLQSSAGGEWDNWRDVNGRVVCKAMKRVALMDVDYYAQCNPGISFRLADSNGQPLSIPITVSSELSADELGKLGALDIDKVYEGEHDGI